MSDLNKCFRCGMFDIEGVAICRVHGHEIKKPMDETCENLIQLDTHVDQLNEQITEVNKNEKVLLDTNKALSTAIVKLKKESDELSQWVIESKKEDLFKNRIHKIDVLTKCVEFYASKNNWTFEGDLSRQVSIVSDGYGAIANFQLIKGGLRARKCLEKINSTTDKNKD